MGLMPFYGFCEADDPALLRHSRLALTPQNALYASHVDGIHWFDGDGDPLGRADVAAAAWGSDHKWHCATFPAWTTALAGAGDEEQLRRELDRIARLTDLDGSIWWWPYAYGETDPAAVKRHPVKCGWAAGVYLCRFVHDILGLQLDAPRRRLAFRPFCPWRAFAWRNCRLGHSTFDVSCTKADGRIEACVRNRNDTRLAVAVELALPPGAEAGPCLCNGRPATGLTGKRRYGRPAVLVEAEVDAGQALTFEVQVALDRAP